MHWPPYNTEERPSFINSFSFIPEQANILNMRVGEETAKEVLNPETREFQELWHPGLPPGSQN